MQGQWIKHDGTDRTTVALQTLQPVTNPNTNPTYPTNPNSKTWMGRQKHDDCIYCTGIASHCRKCNYNRCGRLSSHSVSALNNTGHCISSAPGISLTTFNFGSISELLVIVVTAKLLNDIFIREIFLLTFVMFVKFAWLSIICLKLGINFITV